MGRYKSILVGLLLLSSLFLVVYTRPPTRVGVDPIDPAKFMFTAHTGDIDISSNTGFVYSISIYEEDSNYTETVFTEANHTGSLQISLSDPGIYYIVIETDSVGILEIQSTGIPLGYIIYMLVLTVLLVIVHFRPNRDLLE